MGRLRYLAEAKQDLYDIWLHVREESQSLDVADRLIDSIDDAALKYASQPRLGELRPDLATEVRCFPVESYVVFYVALTNGIEVIQVIHGARDIPVQFRRR